MGTDTRDDDRLMDAVANDRDCSAFTELYKRHERAAWNLARYLLKNDADAEDTLQESFSSVWKSASSFKPGNARGWILRIVSRNCFRKLNKTRRQQELATMGTNETALTGNSPVQDAERSELSGMLRRLLERLSTPERQIVALYYGAGLSQEDIAETLAMPQRTVSHRVKEILSRLRSELGKAGFAGAVATVTPDTIGEAVCSGHPVPQGLEQSVLKASISTGATAVSRRGAASVSAGSTGSLAWITAAVLAVAAGAGLWWSVGSSKTNSVLVPTQLNGSARAEVEEKLHRKWSFKKGAPTDLTVSQGDWRWQKGSGNRSGAMLVAKEAWVRLPMQMPRKPVTVTARVRPAENKGWVEFGTYWTQGREVSERAAYFRKQKIRPEHQSFTLRFYMWDRNHVTLMDDKLFTIAQYKEAYASETLHLSFANLAVESIEIRELAFEEIPEEVRGFESKLSELFHGPLTKRGFTFEAPEGTSRAPE